jgi:beta-lactamase class A
MRGGGRWIVGTVVAVAVVAALGWTLTGRERSAGSSAPVAGSPATAGSTVAASPTPVPTSPSAAPGEPVTGVVAQSAAAAVDAVDAAHAGVDIGAAVLDLDTGQVALGAGGSDPFYAASVAKLLTVVDVLHRAETGDLTLTDPETGWIEQALRVSDDSAMNRLWDTFGGSATVADVIDLVGLSGSAPPDDPSQWGETTVTAADVVTLYRYVLDDLAPEHRDLVLDALRGAADAGADGFDQAFGLLAPPRPDGVAAKQGWMWIGSEFYLHTTGLVGDDRYAVALLSRHTASLSSAVARAVMDDASGAALDPLLG